MCVGAERHRLGASDRWVRLGRVRLCGASTESGACAAEQVEGADGRLLPWTEGTGRCLLSADERCQAVYGLVLGCRNEY